LLNKEHSAENLDFYFWYLDYCRRFLNTPEQDQAKSLPPKEQATSGSYSLPLGNLKKKHKPNSRCQDRTEFSLSPAELEYETEQGRLLCGEIDAVLCTFFHVDLIQRTQHPRLYEQISALLWLPNHAP
jgi:hypothetical protein